ncbi:MAG: hypothetical protein P1V81_10780 [Planctomycetota bacterium]|nr:hypothetical protein [Planctomycetota bacterium]
MPFDTSSSVANDRDLLVVVAAEEGIGGTPHVFRSACARISRGRRSTSVHPWERGAGVSDCPASNDALPSSRIAEVFDVPASGGTLLVDWPSLLLPPPGFATVPLLGGSGSKNLALPLGTTGITFFAQVAVLDATQPGGLALSNGLAITICP